MFGGRGGGGRGSWNGARISDSGNYLTDGVVESPGLPGCVAIQPTLPEVDRAFGKIGRADTATTPAPLTMIKILIQLRPESGWRSGMTVDRLLAELDRTIGFPSVTNAWG